MIGYKKYLQYILIHTSITMLENNLNIGDMYI